MERIKIVLFISLFAFMLACNTGENKSEMTMTEKSNGVTTSTFKVWGNCDMCKETIENSLKVKGIIDADWNVESKMMTVSYDDKLISLDSIQKNISSVGYDNETYKGNDLAYSELHTCCQYDRK